MKNKKIILCIILLSIFVMLSQSVNATAIISKELKSNELINKKVNTVLINEQIKKILSSNNMESLHDIVMMIWEIISIFIGHNDISLLLTRLCCCWFVFPIVLLNNIMNFNISGGGLFALIQECLDSYDFEDIIYRFGALSLFLIPIVYIFVFIICLVDTIFGGIHFEGSILDGMKKDLEYIYTPDWNLGNFIPDNNNKSNYTFRQFLISSDIKDYYYHTGFLSMLLLPVFFLKYKSMIKDTTIKTLDGIPDRPFFNFILKLLKMFMDFILRLFGKIPSVLYD